MQSVLIVVHLMIVVVLVVTVLLQRSEGGALGVGGGGGFMTGRGQASALTRATAILAALFFATSMGLTILARFNQAPEVTFQSITPIEPRGRRGKRGGGQGKFARPIATDGRPGGQAAGASAGYDLAGPAETGRACAARAARSEFAARKSARDAAGSAGGSPNRACRAARFHHGATGAAGRARPGQDSAPGLGSAVVEIIFAFMCKKGSGA